MQLNKNRVIEINLKDLFFHILYRWRSILIAAIIGAVVLCGYQYFSIKKVHDAGKVTKEERQYQLNLQKYHDDLENNQNIIRVNTKLLQGQNNYRKESIYFQLDSQRIWTASKNYLVKVDQSVLDKLPQGSTIDPTDSVLSAYTAPLSEATDEELKEAFGIDKPEYVSELVGTTVDTNGNTITVSVKGASKETALTGLELLHSKMEELAAGKAQEIDKHTLQVVNESVRLGSDDNLTKKQEEVAETITKLQESLQRARQSIDDLEASGEPQAPGQHLIKMSVIGFILGAVLLAFLYAVLYVTNGRFKNANDLSARYNLPILGEFFRPGQIHNNKGFDKLLSRIELGKDIPNEETVYSNIAALIAEKQEKKSIQLVTTLSADKLQRVRDALIKRLPDRTIELQADANRNSEAITESSKADAVIIAEEKGVSKLKDMDRMAENLIIAETNVIGAIIL